MVLIPLEGLNLELEFELEISISICLYRWFRASLLELEHSAIGSVVREVLIDTH